MKKVFIPAILVLSSLIFSGCGLFDRALEIPSSVSIDVPDNMKNSAVPAPLVVKAPPPLPGNGFAYKWMKDFVTLGISAADGVDTILTAVAANKELLAVSKGVPINTDTAWYLFNEAADGTYYLYMGKGATNTNLYIDWKRIEAGKFSGKAVFSADNADDGFSKALVKFDNSVASPYVDIVFDINNASVSGLEKVRVTISKVGADEVSVTARGVTTNTGTNDLKFWDFSGYGKMNSDGGVYAWAKGYFTNNTLPNFSGQELTYNYEEYFDASAVTTYELGWASITTNSITFNWTNIGSTTNIAKPAVSANVYAYTNNLLDSCDYPVVSFY